MDGGDDEDSFATQSTVGVGDMSALADELETSSVSPPASHEMDPKQHSTTTHPVFEGLFIHPHPSKHLSRAKYADEIEAWIAAIRPGADYLARGSELVETRSLPMLRIVGERSASRTIGSRLGGADARNAWSQVEQDWIESCISHMVAKAPPERKAHVRFEMDRALDPHYEFALHRRLASELHQHIGDLRACWAWDAWIARKPFSQLEIVATTLTNLVRQGVVVGPLPPPECPIGLHSIDMARAPTVWRSLHPCVLSSVVASAPPPLLPTTTRHLQLDHPQQRPPHRVRRRHALAL